MHLPVATVAQKHLWKPRTPARVIGWGSGIFLVGCRFGDESLSDWLTEPLPPARAVNHEVPPDDSPPAARGK